MLKIHKSERNVLSLRPNYVIVKTTDENIAALLIVVLAASIAIGGGFLAKLIRRYTATGTTSLSMQTSALPVPARHSVLLE